MDLIFPKALQTGDKIAIISPASVVKEEYVYGAMERLLERGYEPVLMSHALGPVSGSFAASREDRLIDIIEALEDSDIKAILCSRGGYGCTQFLDKIPAQILYKNPKWIIGFSDVSALLALWYSSGVAGIHAPMAKHLATMPIEDPCSQALFSILENGGHFDYKVASHKNNVEGNVTGILRGGNFAVLNDLSGSLYDILSIKQDEDVILFLEDISEPIYKVNRMLYRLLHADVFHRVKGVIFGQFTEYHPDKNYDTMEDMIHNFITQSIVSKKFPVAFDFPVGHTDFNLPLIEGAKVELSVQGTHVRLCTIF